MSFRTVELSKFIKIQGGYAYKSNDFKIGGENPVLKIKNVRFGHIEYEDSGFISDELANSTDNFSTSEGDILISMTGSGPSAPQSLVGRGARVWQGEPKAWINQRVGRVILKEENKIHPDFIFYLLSSNSSQHFLVANSSGSANQANINGSTIGLLPCPDIDFDTSKEIAIILISLDEKIRINRQINRTLEEIAQAIFKSWFVDFEPTKAKIAAREALLAENPAATPEQIATAEQQAAIQAIAGAGDIIPTEQLQTIADLFPNQLVDSELGDIPEGWGEMTLSDVTSKLFSGGTPSTKNEEFWGGEYPWFSSGETRNRFVISTEKSITSEGVRGSSTKKATFGDILIASAGQGFTRGQTSFNSIETYINQSVVAVRANDEVSCYWLFYNLNRRYDEMRSMSDSHSSRGSLTTKLLKLMPIIKPSKQLVSSFDVIIKYLVGQQIINQVESDTLAKIRDVLLPKLLSGELSVQQKELES